MKNIETTITPLAILPQKSNETPHVLRELEKNLAMITEIKSLPSIK